MYILANISFLYNLIFYVLLIVTTLYLIMQLLHHCKLEHEFHLYLAKLDDIFNVALFCFVCSLPFLNYNLSFFFFFPFGRIMHHLVPDTQPDDLIRAILREGRRC